MSAKEKTKNIYDPRFVKEMFDRMSKTYGFANYVTSFGFTEIWRKQCVRALPEISMNSTGFDLMTGMGEAWEGILSRIGKNGKLIALDISDSMIEKAVLHKERIDGKNIEILKADVLQNNIPDQSADFIVSTFGVKTFNTDQLKRLSKEVFRILKPNGVFSFVEISKPEGWFLSWLYMFYLKWVIPLIGKVFLGNTEDYRMLGKYCNNFRDCKAFMGYLKVEGLAVEFKSYFYGCATGVVGTKINNGSKSLSNKIY